MKKKNILPINAFYLTWLREKGKLNRPVAKWTNKRTGEIIEKTEMDTIDLLLYIMLLSRANRETLTCFPSIDAICKDCGGLDRRKVWRSLEDLEQMRFIEIKRERGKPNNYFMSDFARWRKSPRY